MSGHRNPHVNPHVLLVEDEESFVQALTVGLRHEGMDISVARDVKDALDILDDITDDIVLLDIMLPNLSVIDVFRDMRRRSNVPILMVTAKSEEVDTVVGVGNRRRRLHYQTVPTQRTGSAHQGAVAAAQLSQRTYNCSQTHRPKRLGA